MTGLAHGIVRNHVEDEVVGSVVGDYVPLVWVKRVAATAFIVIGVLMLFGKF